MGKTGHESGSRETTPQRTPGCQIGSGEGVWQGWERGDPGSKDGVWHGIRT